LKKSENTKKRNKENLLASFKLVSHSVSEEERRGIQKE
jgi:hypothetical protein